VWSGLLVGSVVCAIDGMVVCALDDCLFLFVCLEVDFVDTLAAVNVGAVSAVMISRSLTRLPVIVTGVLTSNNQYNIY
jgi:hypothetical protein